MNWKENVRSVEPYTPGEQPKGDNIIKLNTNECPYPPAPEVQKAIENMQYSNLRLYPDTESTILTEALADFHDLNTNQIFIGVGSDDVLALSFLTYFNSDKPVLFPDITYSFYDVWAKLYKVPFQQQPLNSKFEICPEDYCCENGGIVIANPNAPTGISMGVNDIERIIKANPDVVVIVDEAYVDFGAETCIPLIPKYDNLLVVRTFSKSRSMAGLRIGYAMGQKELIQCLSDNKNSINSYTMNRPAQEIGAFSVYNKEYFYNTVAKIVETRERFKEAIKELGFSCTDSKTNFVFVTHDTLSIKEIFEAAKAEGIYFRYWNKPRISNYMRVTIGTDEEMDCVIKFLKKYVLR